MIADGGGRSQAGERASYVGALAGRSEGCGAVAGYEIEPVLCEPALAFVGWVG